MGISIGTLITGSMTIGQSGSSGHSYTRVTWQDDSYDDYEWSGELSYETIDNEESIGWNYDNWTWAKQPKAVDIGNTVTRIGSYVFSCCSGLTSVMIGSDVTFIGTDAFSFCSGLTNVTIPSGVTSFGDYVFEGCSELTSITMEGKSISDVENMGYSDWGLPSGCTIHCTADVGGDITIS